MQRNFTKNNTFTFNQGALLQTKTSNSSSARSTKATGDFDKIIFEVLQCISEIFITMGVGFVHFLKQISRQPILVAATLVSIYFVALYATKQALHLELFYAVFPNSFYLKLENWLVSYPFYYHHTAIGLIIFSGITFGIGLPLRWIRSKYKKIFETVGLKNKLGETPIVTQIRKINRYQKQIKLNAKGLGLESFENKISDLETMLNRTIESITMGKSPKFININITSKILPTLTQFSEVNTSKLANNSFYIGEALEGDVKADLSKLPHLMIAGTTGGGKSNFFKQALLGLLKSTNKMQMYLIDLKGGLEMIDFKKAPNVKVTKNVSGSLKVLKLIESEMKSRFSYLEKHNKKLINPNVDPFDRIICAIDEASLLYGKVNKLEDDYEQIAKARSITDNLTKLGRAAGIHVIFATQKVTKETISTSIQENISARLCFKMNTLQGSLQVLGNGDAMNLPEIPGRGIWSYGTKRIEVQVPLITSKEILDYCEHLKETGVNLNQPLLGEVCNDDKRIEQQNNLLQELI